jgi:hypothetical protein
MDENKEISTVDKFLVVAGASFLTIFGFFLVVAFWLAITYANKRMEKSNG